MAMKGDREICLAAGVNEYISKPIDLPLLASLVAKYSQGVGCRDAGEMMGDEGDKGVGV